MLDPASEVILWGTTFLFLGVVGRYVAQWFHQPSVLGELLVGVLIGNLCYFYNVPIILMLRDTSTVFAVMKGLLAGGALPDVIHAVVTDPQSAKQLSYAFSQPNADHLVQVTYVVDIFSRYGVIFLLFMVGLDSSLTELKKTGKASLGVACVGVFAPLLLGLIGLPWLFPASDYRELLFVSATLCATSVGITARVLRDLNQLNTREAKTILGAAMIDDVLGLILLAVISNLVIQQHVQWGQFAGTVFGAFLFFPIVFIFGPWLLRYMVKSVSFLADWEAKVLVSFVFLMGLSWFATVVQMSSIIGAFSAGVVLHDGFFVSRMREMSSPQSIKQLMSPLEAVFSPLFFVLIGIQVHVESFFHLDVIWPALALILIAMVGKLVSGLAVRKKDNRWLVGVGMMPRGEVGLIFASVGKTIGVISDTLFTSIVLMVLVTTLLTPVWIKRVLKKT